MVPYYDNPKFVKQHTASSTIQQIVQMASLQHDPEYQRALKGVIHDLSAQPLVRIATKRAEWAGISIDVLGAAMLSHACSGNPGNLVMLLFGLKKMYPQHATIDVWDVARLLANKGIPTEESFGLIWNDQKDSDGSNRLDDQANWH